jgi:hypothetical protein
MVLLGRAFSARILASESEVTPSVTATLAPVFFMNGSTTWVWIVCPSGPAQNCARSVSPSKRRWA